MKQIDSNHFELSTGRTIYANCGILGLGPDLHVSYGYDGGVHVWPRSWANDAGWTKDERQELADNMIALWQTFREADAPLQED